MKTSTLITGQARFTDRELAALQSSAGTEQAWRHAIQQDPTTAAGKVSGGFAVCTEVDGKTFLAVDRFAIETLCYRIDGPSIRVASRASDLADDQDAIAPQAIFNYLYFHCIPSPGTIYKQVFRLPPGHYAVFEGGKLTVAPYWVPQFRPQGGLRFEDARQEFLGLLKQSVAEQLDGGKPGCFLSGGTDSSTVAGMVREACGRPAATYSIGFDAEGYDEMAYARLAAKHFGTEHHEYYVTPDDLVKRIPSVAAHYDQPFGNSSALPAYYCARMAQQDGVTRILAGDGGDELFGGNSRYAKQRVFGWWRTLPQGLRKQVLDPFFLSQFAANTPLLKKANSYVEQASVDMPARLQMYNLILRLGVKDVLTPDFLAAVDLDGPNKHQQAVWDSVGPASELNTTLAFDWRYTLGESDLPKVRETCRLADLAVGFPMLNRDLLDFSLKLPDDFKLKGLKLRWFFKEALRGFLPDDILTKKKQGFGLPFGVWMTKHPALYALAQDSLHTLAGRGIVRPDFITALLKQHLPTYPGYYGEMVWILMMLEQWLRHHAPSFRLKG